MKPGRTTISRRIKPAPPMAIEDLTDANALMHEMGLLRQRLREIENTLCQRLQEARQNADSQASPVRERLRLLETSLASFARQQRETLFSKRRGVTLTSGAFGFRKSSEIRPAPQGNWDEVLSRIQTLGLTEALRQRHEVNRETLQEWPQERLALVGARRVTKEGFWYEIREETLFTPPHAHAHATTHQNDPETGGTANTTAPMNGP